MDHQFTKHYTVDEARALIPQLRKWLEQVQLIRTRLDKQDDRLGQMLAVGNDCGGPLVNDWLRNVSALRKILYKFQELEIQVKDINRGLVDFPAFKAGREVFLCWEMDEDDVEYWHDLDTGYAGREKLDE